MALPEEIRNIPANVPQVRSGTTKAQEALAEALSFLKGRWKLSGAKIGELLHLRARTINDWLKKGKVPIEEPLSPEVQTLIHLLAIHRSLEAMFSEPQNQVVWLTTKHPDFECSPWDKIKKSIEDLIMVRRYLDYARGRGA